MMTKIFSGIRPTSKTHLGNYLGAIKQWLYLQAKFSCIFCIVDYHGITTPFTPKELKKNIFDLALDLLALGINPKKSILFIQSQVPEHTELAWIFNTITPMAELKRMTQFKDKSKLHQDYANAGLFDYPVLMAADILIYKASGIPVGEDQVQHVELARLIARKFNNMFGQTFPEPNTILSPHPRVMSLQNPKEKMSSSAGPKNYIALDDSPEAIKQKIMTAVTDSGSVRSQEKSPAIANLFSLLKEFSTPKTVFKFEADYQAGRIKYSELKEQLIKDISQYFSDFRTKRKKLAANPKEVKRILDQGAKKARVLAQATLEDVKKKLGLI